jgi:hypothetical protein
LFNLQLGGEISSIHGDSRFDYSRDDFDLSHGHGDSAIEDYTVAIVDILISILVELIIDI